MTRILLCSSAAWVHDLQAYRKMDVTRERISRIVELRETLRSFQTGFSLVNAAVVCAILESTSGLEPSSDTTEPRHSKLVTVSSFCPFTWISALIYFGLSVNDIAKATPTFKERTLDSSGYLKLVTVSSLCPFTWISVLIYFDLCVDLLWSLC